jgi:hypothetical protein
VDPRVGLDGSRKSKDSCICRESNRDSSVGQPVNLVTILTELSPAPHDVALRFLNELMTIMIV